MATTSIWSVKGWLSKVLIYVENPEKTENPKFFESSVEEEDGLQRLDDVIAYASDEQKTERHLYVTGVNVNPNIARDQMMEVKQKFEKTGGTVAYHGYQSFAPGEATPELAHEIGVKLAEQLWGEHFQVIVATHTDQEHVHNHFVVNTVSMIDGHRYRRTKKDYADMQKTSDALCREHGLSVIENPKQGRSRQYGEWKAEKDNKPTWRSLIKNDVDEAIKKSTSTRQFFQNLKNLGYEIKIGADISVRPPNKERYFRLARNFGEDYTEENIKRRILSERIPQLSIPRQSQSPYPQNQLPNIPKGTIVGLYRHYCYLFGIHQKSEGGANRMPFALREELRRFDEITADEKLLIRVGIETGADLAAHQSSLEGEIASLVAERKQIQTADKKANGGEKPTTQNPRVVQINERLKKLRKEVRQCKRIKERSGALAEKLERMEQAKDTETRKEVRRNGRNRTGNRPDGKGASHGL